MDLIIKNRDNIDNIYKWGVSEIFESDSAWEDNYKHLQDVPKELNVFEGCLGDSSSLKKFLFAYEKAFRALGKLYMYAALKNHEDTSNTEYQSMLSKANTLNNECCDAVAFFVPEILNIGEDAIYEFVQNDSDLSSFEFYFKDIFSNKKHILSKKEEALLSKLSDTVETPSNLYDVLADADMTFESIVCSTGERLELTDSNYSVYAKSSDRYLRKAAFVNLFKGYDDFKNTFATALISNTKNNSTISDIRNYSSSIEAALSQDKIPTDVYDATVNTINENLSSLHRYMGLKKRLLNLDEIHLYDISAPLFEKPESSYSFEKAKEIVTEGLSLLGDEYVGAVAKGLDTGWVDVFPSKGKRGGAYSWGTYDTEPYILMNYLGELGDVFTLAHEIGHSMHSYYSRKKQSWWYSSYSMFNAEVASTTNEILLINHLLNSTDNPALKRYLVVHELEQIRNTVFRQTMFAEFEKEIHAIIDDNGALTHKELCSMWYELYKKYYGNEMVIDQQIEMEWARIPHFYQNFYVYQYATGYAAATKFASTILEDEKDALSNYKTFLESGGNGYSIDILKKSGVDMTTSEPMESVMDRFNYLLDLLENEL